MSLRSAIRWAVHHRCSVSPAPLAGVTLSRGEHEAIHAKLDQLLKGQGLIMAQQDELLETLTAIGSDVDGVTAHVVDLENKLAAKADDLGVDLSPELTLAKAIRAKLEGVSSAITASPAGDDPAPTNNGAAGGTTAEQPAAV